MKIGGPAKYFFIAEKENDLTSAVNWAEKKKIKWYIVGDGSNLVPNDKGFNGVIIKNEVKGLKRDRNKVYVGAGENLLKLIRKLNRFGLKGVEKMAGIPGTVGGAIYGSAGAYGQEIKNCLIRIKVFDGKKSFWLSKEQCLFGYRESIFKKKKFWVILGAEFKFKKSGPRELQRISEETIKIREKKYWPGLSCPGSFFKNIVINDVRPVSLRQEFLSKIDKAKINHGKVPAGYLLEEAGAKGMGRGGIRVAKHHGNLIYNSGKGKSSEITEIAGVLKDKVRKRFGIYLEEEIQYV